MTPAIAPVTNLYCNGTMGSRRFAGAAFADIVTLKGDREDRRTAARRRRWGTTTAKNEQLWPLD